MGALPQGPVKIIVGGILGAGLLWAFFNLLSFWWWAFCVVLLAVEAWAFFNPYANDTISEVVWALSERPLVPLLFGAATAWSITSGFIPATREGMWVSLFIGVIMGHFFWQRQGDKIESAIRTLDKAEPILLEAVKDKVQATDSQ